MTRRLLLAAALLALALPASAGAAEPAAATISAESPATSWHGTVTGGYASYAALVLAEAGGAEGSVPCVAPSCDSYALTVAGGPRRVQIVVRSPQTEIVSVRVTSPSGRARYDSGFADPAETVVEIPSAEPGTYTVAVTTNALDEATYTATASSSEPDPPSDGPRDYDEYTYEKVRIPMRDGVEISAEIWRPKTAPGVKVPVIAHLTPYHVLSPANAADRLPMVDGAELVFRGYAFVFADVRGTWASGGCWDYGGEKEIRDGHDLVEWLGTRDWSNGKVGMMGVSYPGTTPNATAISQPKHLATIVPISGISRWYGYAYQQGARATYSGESDDIDPPGDTPTDFMFAYGFLPPPDAEALASPDQTSARWHVCGRTRKAMKGYSTQPDYDAFWKARDYLRRAKKVKVPVLLSHGLQDFNVKTWEGTAWWEAVRGPKALVLGQWPHAYPGTYWDKWQGLMERWFARYLYGVENGVEDEPRVHVQTNDGAWHDQADFGPNATVATAFSLGGSDFSFTDDGLLTESEVLRGVGEGTRWTRVPVPGTDGPLRFGGRPVLSLSATSDAPGTHATAVLLDVDSAGAAVVISRAFMNARYREGLARGIDLPAGHAVTLPLEFIDKDWIVAAGHHLELRIASSSATWVLSDEHRAGNVFHLGESSLELPLYTE
jgi:X-Pro dipeptidyl-peptidase